MSASLSHAPPERFGAGSHALTARLCRATSPALMRQAIARAWPTLGAAGTRVTGCDIDRVYPRGDRGFVVAYCVRVHREAKQWNEMLYAELVPGDTAAHFQSAVDGLHKSRRKQLPRDEKNDVITHLPDLGLVLRRPGYDEALDGLTVLHSRRAARRALVEALAPEGRVANVATHLLSHRLGKRCVLRVHYDWCEKAGASAVERRSVIAKLTKPRSAKGRRMQRALQALWREGFSDRSEIRVPRFLGRTGNGALHFMEDVPGLSLDLLMGTNLEMGLVGAGRALAKLHRSSFDPAGEHTVEDEIALISAWVALIGSLRPARRSALEAAWEAVVTTLRRLEKAPLRVVHRDYHEKQVLISGDQIVLIDFDTLCLGDPALDVGNFLAHLRFGRQTTRAGTDVRVRAFLDGYGRIDDPAFDRRVEAYVDSTLLRLTCLHALSTWPGAARSGSFGARGPGAVDTRSRHGGPHLANAHRLGGLT